MWMSRDYSEEPYFDAFEVYLLPPFWIGGLGVILIVNEKETAAGWP